MQRRSGRGAEGGTEGGEKSVGVAGQQCRAKVTKQISLNGGSTNRDGVLFFLIRAKQHNYFLPALGMLKNMNRDKSKLNALATPRGNWKDV